jgi:Na+/H+-dicarboxylate symporter
MITRFIPAAVFCSVALMMRRMDAGSLLSLLGMTGTHVLCIFFMLIVYGLLILVLGKLNQLTFYKKNKEGMITSFTLASSSAAMPVNMKTCTDKLGISSKVCSFSIPLGATVNMDGTCIHLAVFSLALAHAYGVQVTDASLVGVVVAIVVLSIGAGIPGSGLICLSVLLSQMNVPVEAIGLVMGIDSLAGMLRTVGNCLGDVVVTLLVAKREGALDSEIYHG